MKTNKITIYYIVFLFATAVFTSTVLLYYSYLLNQIIPKSNLIREYAICFGQLFFQGTLLLIAKEKTDIILSYLKNMMMVSFIGALLLVPLIIIDQYIQINFIIYLVYFFMVVLFMFFNHKKRIYTIQAPWWLTYTWVLYRCIVLLIIL